MKKVTLIIIVLMLAFSFKVDAYDTKTIHPFVNEKAALTSVNFISMLRSWGYKEVLPNDILESNTIAGLTLKKWLRLGGTEEDNGTRWLNHFHDPTQAWDNAGLGGLPRYSFLLWAQNKQSQASLLLSTNDFAWPNARASYYKVFTAETKTARERELSNTLKTLGQVMHLLADAAVPEHVRNDSHALGSKYEEWCAGHGAMFTNVTVTAVDYSVTNMSNVPGIIPISNFWDTTPGLIPPDIDYFPVGLAEYTNHNFLSKDTIFKVYTYPEKPENKFLKMFTAKDGKPDQKLYFKGQTSDGKDINFLAATGYFWYELSLYQTLLGSNKDAMYNLDNYCHENYAQILIPQAISYNAGLLNYFFRGKINLVEPDPNGRPNKYVIKNESDDEAMSGTFSLYYDDKQDNRTFITSWTTGTILPRKQYPDPDSVPPVDLLTFPVPNMDVAKEYGSYILVFQGTLGNESNAIIGRVIRSFREEWNNGLQGNHLWLTTGSELTWSNGVGHNINTVENGVLRKEDTVFRGESPAFSNVTALYHSQYCKYKPNSYCAQGSEGLSAACFDCFPKEFGKEFPYPVDASTWIDLKVDEMSINLSSDCASGLPDPRDQAYQCVKYWLQDKAGFDYYISFSVDGQGCWSFDDNDKYYYDITAGLGKNVGVTIYTMLADLYEDRYKDVDPDKVFDPSEVEPITLKEISFNQQIYNTTGTCDSVNLKMVVDYVRVMDR